MNKLYVGKVVGTHGIKGEIKINSEVEIKNKIFKENTELYFSDLDEKYKIKNVRVHKDNYLVLLEKMDNINDVLYLNKKNVYVNRDLFLNENEYVIDDLIGFEVIDENNNIIGVIKDYIQNPSYSTFLVEGIKKIYIPNVSNYIANIDLKNKKVYTKNVGDLML